MSTSTASRAPIALWVSVLWLVTDTCEDFAEGDLFQQSHAFTHTDAARAVSATMRRLSRVWEHMRVLSVLVHTGEEAPSEDALSPVFDKVRADYLETLPCNCEEPAGFSAACKKHRYCCFQ